MSSHCRRSSRAAETRSAGRSAGLGAAALFIAASQFTPIATPVASAADCADAELVFARGTDEPVGMGRVGDAFFDSLRKEASGMSIKSYAVNYDAGKLQLHGGDGAKDAISHIKSTVASCPNTQIILGGYSQGASIVDIVAGIPVGGIKWGDPLPPELADNVAAVATFGDVADRAGGSLPSQSTLFAGKAIDLCNPADPICHAGPGNAWSGHTQGYVPAYTDQAATFAASKLLIGTSQTEPGSGSPLYASPPPGSDHMPPGYGSQAPGYYPSTPGYGQAPGYAQAPDYNSSAPGYDQSVVTGLP
jgi:cutinase